MALARHGWVPGAADWSRHELQHHALQQSCLSHPVLAAYPWGR